jgi:SnoaL-like protein
MTGIRPHSEMDHVIERWEAALGAHDADGLVATYAEDAVLESPLVLHVTGNKGQLRGHRELRPFFENIVKRTPTLRGFHRGVYFADGGRAIWEYPRDCPNGEQMDFVEVMEIENALIQRHRVYWGWRGVDLIMKDEYYR